VPSLVFDIDLGLVGITPSAGYVAPWAAIVIGLVTAVICNFGAQLKERIGADDALDSFYLHGVGGFVGCILTGVFAQKWIGLLDGTSINGGVIDGNGIQVGYQIAGAVAIAAYSFIGTLLILAVINVLPGMKLRLSPDHEEMGCDFHEMGETAYEISKINSSDSNENVSEDQRLEKV
jgi:ammonium transporter, Amt family